MNCNNYFDMTDQGDSFESWQGLRGPAGPQGTPGAPGSNVELKGPVATTGDLPATAPASELWQVGTESPYNGYFFNGTSWVNLGPVAAGAAGATFTPAVSSGGVISWTNDRSLPNPEPVSIKGPRGGTGLRGPAGPGVPEGGSAGMVLKKQSATDYDAAWQDDDLGITGASVGDLVRISAVDANNKPTVFTKAPLNAIKCNRNLLDNWYFVGGGSQLGYGTFPVNQRGQVSYMNSGYSIDRWNDRSAPTVTVSNGGIDVSGGNDYKGIYQNVGSKEAFLNKTVTITAWITALSGGSARIALGNSQYKDTIGTAIGDVSATSPGVWSATFTMPASYSQPYLNFTVSGDVAVSFSIAAVKLELGDTQTLAHQKNGVWVLNEVPDYATELAKCQAYLLPIPAYARTRTSFVIAGRMDFEVPLAVPMAKAPSIDGAIRVSSLDGVVQTGFTFDVGGISAASARIRAYKTNHGMTDGFIDSDAVWYLSAE